ncbi:hypothetical protein ACFLZP_02110 [Patescibacteria group bacterium]
MKKPWIWFVFFLLVLFLTFLGFFAYQRFSKHQPASPKAAPSKTLVELHLDGGFAGFCDRLVVGLDGAASLFNSCHQRQKDFSINPDLLNQLVGLSSELEKFTYKYEDNSGGPDSLQTNLVFYGQGTTVPSDQQKKVIIQLVSPLIYQNRR